MLTTAIIAGIVTFVFTTLLTIAGVGAAFILIPVFIYLGIDVYTAMATALLLNSVAMVFAGYRFVKNKLVIWSIAIPILIFGVPLSPLGAYVAQGLDRKLLLWLFVAFLLFAAVMMLFYKSKEREKQASRNKQLAYGGGVGATAGFLGGMLGVGGGNFIVPVLVWLGFNPKKASATTSFVVIFTSFAGFLGHATVGALSWQLLLLTAVGSAGGALLGAWLMTDKLNRRQVKLIIGIILLLIAGKMIWKLLTPSDKNGKAEIQQVAPQNKRISVVEHKLFSCENQKATSLKRALTSKATEIISAGSNNFRIQIEINAGVQKRDIHRPLGRCKPSCD